MKGVMCSPNPNRKVISETTLQHRLLVTHLLYFSEESVGTLDLPLTQLSQGHLLEVNLKTGER